MDDLKFLFVLVPFRIDLHYLQTGEAIKQLQHFVGQWERYLITGQSQYLEIVTGRGNRQGEYFAENMDYKNR